MWQLGCKCFWHHSFHMCTFRTGLNEDRGKDCYEKPQWCIQRCRHVVDNAVGIFAASCKVLIFFGSALIRQCSSRRRMRWIVVSSIGIRTDLLLKNVIILEETKIGIETVVIIAIKIAFFYLLVLTTAKLANYNFHIYRIQYLVLSSPDRKPSSWENGILTPAVVKYVQYICQFRRQ